MPAETVQGDAPIHGPDRAADGRDPSFRRVVTNDGERLIPLTADPQVPGEYRSEISVLLREHQIEPVGPAIQQLLAETEHSPVRVSVEIQPEGFHHVADPL